jgi:hypothetical protein
MWCLDPGGLICPWECGYIQDISTLEDDAPFHGNIWIQLSFDAEPYYRSTESSVIRYGNLRTCNEVNLEM